MVAAVAVDNGIVGIHGRLISDPQSTVGVAGIDHAVFRVDLLGGVDLPQAALVHLNGHNGFACIGSAVGNGKLTILLRPLGNGIGAGNVGEEFQNHITLVIGQALGQGIDEGVAGQVGAFGGNAGQSGNDLVVDDVAVRGGAGVGVAVGDGAGTIVLAGIVLVFPQGLFQGGNAGEVLREEGNVIDPAGAAVSGVGAIHGGHGQADEEGIAGGDYGFGNLGLHHQIQSQIQILRLGLAIGIRQGHGHAAICGKVAFQRVFHRGGVGTQGCVQGIDENVGLVEILAFIQRVGIGVPAGSIFQTQGFQEVSARGFVNGVQHFHVVGRRVVQLGFGKLNDVCDPQVSKLNTGNGIAVAGIAVAQGSGGAVADEGVIHIGVVDTGGHIAGIPDAVLLGVGQIHLVNGQGAFGGSVDGSVAYFSGGYPNRERQAQQKRQAQSDCLCNRFHRNNSFQI